MKKFSVHHACITLLYIASLFLFASCSDDDNNDNDKGTTPSSEELIYAQVQKASDSSLTIDEIISHSSGTVFVFSDRSRAAFNKEHIVIDISKSSELTISKSAGNTWVINGKDTQIPVVSASETKPIIICATYDNEAATFYLSNGNKIGIECTSAGSITLFKFEANNNEGLEEDITATIKGKEIELAVPYIMPLNSLTATFIYAGQSIKIGETEQVSGTTKNNFSEPVIYTVTTTKGTKFEYTVTVTHKAPRLPRVIVTTEGGASIDTKDTYVRMSVTVEDKDKLYTDGKTFTADAGIRGRGNSTWNEPKKPYRMKLDNKASLLGMSTDKDWALLANHLDKSLLRNLVAFKISSIAEMSWTPGSISVDFYLNGEYRGVYTLTEHVKVSKERLNIDLVKNTDNSGEALTGDYFLELDFHADEKHFRTKIKDLPIMYKDPDEPTSQQEKYVEDYFNNAEAVLYSSTFTDPDNGYRKYIDMESFINYYIIHELSKNADGNMRGSCYLSLRRNGKIEQPLVWDFDLAFGNADHITSEQGASSDGWDGWYIKTCAPWFDRFFEDPAFVHQLKNRWNELKPELDQLPDFIRDHAEKIDESQKKNFGPKVSGGAGWSITERKWNTSKIRGTYEGEINFLLDFVEKRLEWLDKNINGL